MLGSIRRGCSQHLSYLNLSSNNKPVKLVFVFVVMVTSYSVLLGNGTMLYQESQSMKYAYYHGYHGYINIFMLISQFFSKVIAMETILISNCKLPLDAAT